MAHVKNPTDNREHILDPVLSHGFSLKCMELVDFYVSGTVHTLFPLLAYRATTYFSSLSFSSKSPSGFCNKFLAASTHKTTDQSGLSVKYLVDNFTSSCLSILDDITPFWMKRSKSDAVLWLHEYTSDIQMQ